MTILKSIPNTIIGWEGREVRKGIEESECGIETECCSLVSEVIASQHALGLLVEVWLPSFLTSTTRWRRAVNFTPRPPDRRGRSLRSHWVVGFILEVTV
jgi:hypothetical protein